MSEFEDVVELNMDFIRVYDVVEVIMIMMMML